MTSSSGHASPLLPPVYRRRLRGSADVGCAVVERAGMAVLYENQICPGLRPGTTSPTAPGPGSSLIFFFRRKIRLAGGHFCPRGELDRRRQGSPGGRGRCVRKHRALPGRPRHWSGGDQLPAEPQVGWREQVADVALATRWVHQHIASQGGRPDQLFLFGHSAGAQLAAYTGLNPRALTEVCWPGHRARRHRGQRGRPG